MPLPADRLSSGMGEERKQKIYPSRLSFGLWKRRKTTAQSSLLSSLVERAQQTLAKVSLVLGRTRFGLAPAERPVASSVQFGLERK